MSDKNPQPRDFEPSLPPVDVDRDDETTTVVDHDEDREYPFSGIYPPDFLDDNLNQRLSGPRPTDREDYPRLVDHDDPGVDPPSGISPPDFS